MKNKLYIAKILAVIVALVGIMVMVGWIFDIAILKSILPTWVTMKFTTAFSFLLSGLILYFIARLREGSVLAQIVLPVSALIILLIMATLLTSVILGVRTGIEDLFVKETVGAVKTTIPGRPSAGTMIDFILIAGSAMFALSRPSANKVLFPIGVIVAVIGGVAIVGYIVNFPLLYYTVSGWSTAMALHTAILFTLCGIGLAVIGRSSLSPNQSYEH